MRPRSSSSTAGPSERAQRVVCFAALVVRHGRHLGVLLSSSRSRRGRAIRQLLFLVVVEAALRYGLRRRSRDAARPAPSSSEPSGSAPTASPRRSSPSITSRSRSVSGSLIGPGRRLARRTATRGDGSPRSARPKPRAARRARPARRHPRRRQPVRDGRSGRRSTSTRRSQRSSGSCAGSSRSTGRRSSSPTTASARVIAAAGEARRHASSRPGRAEPSRARSLEDVLDAGAGRSTASDMRSLRYPEEHATSSSSGCVAALVAPLLPAPDAIGMISVVREEPDSFSAGGDRAPRPCSGVSSVAPSRTSAPTRRSGRPSRSCAGSRRSAPTSSRSSRTSCGARWRP